MTQTETILRGALEMAIRCIKGEVPADGYVGDVQLLPALERTLAIPDGGEPSNVEQMAIQAMESFDRMEKARLEKRANEPTLRDLFALAALQSPMAEDFDSNDEEVVIKWAYGLANTAIRFRASGDVEA